MKFVHATPACGWKYLLLFLEKRVIIYDPNASNKSICMVCYWEMFNHKWYLIDFHPYPKVKTAFLDYIFSVQRERFNTLA